MAYYLFEEGFENGTKGFFDATTTDSGGRLYFPGPRQLAADGYRIAPYRGGGIMQVDFQKSSADAYVANTTAFDVIGTSTGFFRLMVQAYRLNLANSGDSVSIFRGMSTAAVTYDARLTWQEPEGLVLDLLGNTMAMPTDRWVCIEAEVKVGAGGHVKLYVEGITLAHNPATVAAITDFRLGAMGQTGAITQGSLCFDEVFVDANRMYPPQGPADAMSLTAASLRMRRSGFAFVGAGEILSVQLVAESGTNNTVHIYDTGIPTYAEDDLVEVLTASAGGMTKINQRILRFNRGAWVKIIGDSPLVVMQLGQVGDAPFFEDFGGGGFDESAPMEG